MFHPILAWRQRQRDRARLKLIDELFEHVNAAEPCPDPKCLAFRAEIRSLCKPGEVC